MIKSQEPITMAEVAALAGETEKETKLKSFIAQFVKTTEKDAKAMKAELKSLELIKLKDEHIVKIVDFMPEDAADTIKALPGVALDQDEITKILDIVKKY